MKRVNLLIIFFLFKNFLFSSATYNIDFSTYELRENLVFSNGELKIINKFNRIYPSTYPSGRRKSGMTEISQNRILLFGGTIDSTTFASSDETWIFDFNKSNWELLTNSTHPSKRAGISLVYDRISDKVLLFGGVGEGTYLDDTWIFDVKNKEWQEVFPSTHPSKRHGYGLAISSNSKAILFGGIGEGGNYLNDTWQFDFLNNSWEFLNVSTSPPSRAYMGMAGDGRGKILMFGGEDASGYKNDTWIFENGAWIKQSPATPPSPRTGVSLCYNENGNSFVMTSGYKKELGPEEIVNEVWVFTLDGEWHNATSLFSNLPQERVYSNFVYQKEEGVGFLFGGEGEGNIYLSDSWIHLFFSSGTFISSSIDTGSSIYPVDYFKIKFSGNFPATTSAKFQIATSSDNILFSDFRGPDGEVTSYYTISGEDIYSGEDGRRFLKLKIILNYKIFTEKDFYISSTSITYNHRPEAPVLYDNFFGKGETTSDITPNFTWYNSNDPDGEIHTYNLEVSTEINFISPIVITGIEEDRFSGYSYSWTTPTLTEGHYFFRVKCFDDLTESPYSEIWDFYVDTTAPARVTDLVAITGDSPGEIKLYWTSTGDDGYEGDIVNGKIHIKYKEKENFLNWYSSGLTEIVFSTTTSANEKQFYVLTGLKDNTSYFIAVAIEDEAVEENKNLGVGSDGIIITAFSFTDRFSVVSFKKSFLNEVVSGKFLSSWDSYDPDGDSTIFDIYLSDGQNEILIASKINATYYYINSYDFKNSSYTIKIRATDSRGLSKDYFSESFFINNPNFPPEINVIFPEDNSIVEGDVIVNWVFLDTNSWENHNFEISYSTDGINYNLIETLKNNTTFYIWSTYLLPNGTYFLKVKITDEGGLSNEDYIRNIILKNPNLAPSEFSLLSPSNDEYLYTLYPDFSWEKALDPDGDPVSYSIYISSVSDFSYFYEKKNISGTSYKLDFELQNKSSYYWKIKATDSRGLSRWSNEIFHFHINIGSFSISGISPSNLSSVLYSSITYIEVNFNKPPFNFYEGYLKIYEDEKERTDFSIEVIQNFVKINLNFMPSKKYEIIFSSSIIDEEGNPLTGKRDFTFWTLMSKNEDNNLVFYNGEVRSFIKKNSLNENARLSVEKVYFVDEKTLLNSKNLIETSKAGIFLYPYCYRIEFFNKDNKEIHKTNFPVKIYFRINDRDGNGFWDGSYYPLRQIEIRKLENNNWIPVETKLNEKEMEVAVSEFSYFSVFAKAKYFKASSIIDGLNIFPNPFKDEIYIWYKLNGNYDINFKIYSLSGVKVKEEKIPSSFSPPFIWKGKNDRGEEVADGTYILIIEAGGEKIKKVIAKVK